MFHRPHYHDATRCRPINGLDDRPGIYEYCSCRYEIKTVVMLRCRYLKTPRNQSSAFKSSDLHIPKMGIHIPILGIESHQGTGLADALFSSVQQRVLGILFGQPERRFQSAEIIRLAESGTGAVHRQLKTLTECGLVTMTAVGNQKYYQANQDSPIFAELHGLIIKTIGLKEPLRQALTSFTDQITVAFVYGSIAKGTDRASSDIDLMLISDKLSYSDIYNGLEKAEYILHRPINPNLMTAGEWHKKLKDKNPFVTKVQSSPKVFIIGSDNELETA